MGKTIWEWLTSRGGAADVMLVAGATLMVLGISMIWPPAGVLAAGLGLVFISIRLGV